MRFSAAVTPVRTGRDRSQRLARLVRVARPGTRSEACRPVCRLLDPQLAQVAGERRLRHRTAGPGECPLEPSCVPSRRRVIRLWIRRWRSSFGKGLDISPKPSTFVGTGFRQRLRARWRGATSRSRRRSHADLTAAPVAIGREPRSPWGLSPREWVAVFKRPFRRSWPTTAWDWRSRSPSARCSRSSRR